MDIQIIAAILFVLFMTIFLLRNKKSIVIQKILHPFLYMILYKSNFGIKFINRFVEKYREQVKFFGYCCIGFGFLGMVYVTINILLMLYTLVKTPISTQGVSLVVPFTNIPGIGYLSFLHWIAAIFILALVHEFSHGLVAKAHGLEIKSSGFAFLALFVPLIPAAFVEPDEKKLHRQSDVVKYSIFSAGPMANIFLALIILLAMPYVADSTKLAPFESAITEPIGFSFDLINNTLPAAKAGLMSGMIINSFNGKPVTDAAEFAENLYYCTKPGETITLGTADKSYSIQTINSQDNKRSFIGITNVKNERTILPKYELLKHPYYWTKELFRWLFLLNFFIGIFNLLPLGIVDGGLMMSTLLHKTIANQKKAKKIWNLISLILLAILILSLVSTYLGNPFNLFR